MKKDTNFSIDTSLISKGDRIKNYKHLCYLLNQPVYGGNQKKKQLKEFERYFSYKKEKREFVIKDVYTVPITKTYRIPYNAKYITDIENILLPYLLKEKNEQTYIKKTHLYTLLGLVNNQYLVYYSNRKLLKSIFPTYPKVYIDDFFKRTDDKINKIIMNSLNSLKRREFIIDYNEVYMIGTISSHRSTGIAHCLEADEYETEEIHKIKNTVIQSLGLKQEKEVYLHNKTSQYYALLNDEYSKKGWKTVYKAYKIIFDKAFIKKMKRKDCSIDNYKYRLNSKVLKAMNDQAARCYEKEQKIIKDMELSSSIKLKYSPDYIASQKILADYLIKI